jgi:hypothetical protein
MSAPASACASAIRTSASTVSSFRITPSRTKPVVAVDVVGIERDVGHHRNLGHRRLHRPDDAVRQVVGAPGLLAGFGLSRRLDIGKQADRRNAQVGRPFGRAHRILKTEPPTPGIDEIGSASPSPSRMKIGQIRSFTVRTCS